MPVLAIWFQNVLFFSIRCHYVCISFNNPLLSKYPIHVSTVKWLILYLTFNKLFNFIEYSTKCPFYLCESKIYNETLLTTESFASLSYFIRLKPLSARKCISVMCSKWFFGKIITLTVLIDFLINSLWIISLTLTKSFFSTWPLLGFVI